MAPTNSQQQFSCKQRLNELSIEMVLSRMGRIHRERSKARPHPDRSAYCKDWADFIADKLYETNSTIRAQCHQLDPTEPSNKQLNNKIQKNLESSVGFHQGRIFLEDIFGDIEKFPDPDAFFLCINCDEVLRYDEICHRHPDDENNGGWNREEYTVKSSKCEGFPFGNRTLYCYFDRRSKETSINPCEDCKDHLFYLKEIYTKQYG